MSKNQHKMHKTGWLQKGSRVSKLKELFEDSATIGRKLSLNDIAQHLFGSTDGRARGMSVPVIGGLRRFYEKQPISSKKVLLSIWNSSDKKREYTLVLNSSMVANEMVPNERKAMRYWDKMKELDEYMDNYFPNDKIAKYKVQKHVLSYAKQIIEDTILNLNPGETYDNPKLNANDQPNTMFQDKAGQESAS